MSRLRILVLASFCDPDAVSMRTLPTFTLRHSQNFMMFHWLWVLQVRQTCGVQMVRFAPSRW